MFVCTTCGEVIVFGPAGCACTRAVAEERFKRELAERAAETERIIDNDPELRRKLEEAGKKMLESLDGTG